MNLVWAALIVIATTSVAIALMLLVRRRAPEGSYFNDGDRAAGVFGVLATGFSVLLGFIVFLAFASYDTSRTGAEDESELVAQQVESAQLLPADVRVELTEQLVCYARSVAGDEWDAMEAGTLGDSINPWADDLFRTIRTVEPESNAEQSAYDQWLDQTSQREQARSQRVHGAAGVIPLPLWIVLFFIAAVIVGYMLLFADSGERAVVQAMLMGSVVAVLTALLLLLSFLDQPFHDGVGGLQPDAMERTLRIIDEQLAIVEIEIDPPCNADGTPR